MACGTLSTPEGEVDCGGCPEDLECGQLEPNVCGGLVCTNFGQRSEVVRHLAFTWHSELVSGTPTMVTEKYQSQLILGLVAFEAPWSDSVPEFVATAGGYRTARVITLSGDVVRADATLSRAGGSGSGGPIAKCVGAVRSSTSRP